MATTTTKGTIAVRSEAFGDGRPIPEHYTGEGADLSPPLSWSGLPEETRELALICEDPDAPRPEPWVHWVIYKIPVGTRGLPEGVPREAALTEPLSALQGVNTWDSDNIGYRGPMPPPRHGTHRYFFRLYALDAELNVEPGLDADGLRQAMSHHVLAEGALMGTYER